MRRISVISLWLSLAATILGCSKPRVVEPPAAPAEHAGGRPATQRTHVMPSKKWPPPGYPLVEGDYSLTDTWSIQLPRQFARRLEDGSLVLWRPGLTMWMVAWGNDHNETQAERLAWIRDAASPGRFAEREFVRDGLTRFIYRLHDENPDGPVESLNAFIIGDDGHLQLSIYFDDLADEAAAQQLVESVASHRKR